MGVNMNKRILDYVILSSQYKNELATEIMSWNQIGYELLGGPWIDTESGTDELKGYLYQAMVKYE
jgi:hypothetical protein